MDELVMTDNLYDFFLKKVSMRIYFLIILALESLCSCNFLSDSDPTKRTDIYTGQYRELMEAAKRENLQEIETLVKANRINLNYADSVNGVSLLNWCIFTRKEKSFDKLLQLGADVNWQDTACAFAPAIVEAAKDVNTSEFLRISLQYEGDVNLLSKKMAGIEDQSPLFGAISSYRIESVKMLVEKNAEVNQTQDSFWTPLAQGYLYGYHLEGVHKATYPVISFMVNYDKSRPSWFDKAMDVNVTMRR